MTPHTSPLLRAVDEMLFDAGETDAQLRATLLSLGALASLPVPEPRADLAALLAPQPGLLARRRLRRSRRTAAVGLAVIAGMGLGVTGVAATASAPNPHASRSIQHLMQDWAPSWTVAGTPAALGTAGDAPGTPAAEHGFPEASGPDNSVRGESEPAGPAAGDPSTADVGTPGPATGVPGGAAQESGQGRSKDPGRVPASPGNPASDGGASRNSAGGTSGGGAWQDGTWRKHQEPGAVPGSDPAGQSAKAGKLVTKPPAVVGSLTSALPAPVTAGPSTTEPSTTNPVTTEKTGAGSAGPGSLWLKKFSR